MPRARTLHGIAAGCRVVLLASQVLGAATSAAQPTIRLSPVPGLSGTPDTSLDFTHFHVVAQVSRDGRRLVIRQGASGDTLVVETMTGGVVLDTRPLQEANRTYRSALLDPAGRVLVDVAHPGMSVVRARDLSTGVQQEITRDPLGDLEVASVAEAARYVAMRSAAGSRQGMAYAIASGHAPVFHFGPGCSPVWGCTAGDLTLSADGRLAFYIGGLPWLPPPGTSVTLTATDVESRVSTVVPVRHQELGGTVATQRPYVTRDGASVALTMPSRDGAEARAVVVQPASGLVELVAPGLGHTSVSGISDDGRFVLVGNPYSMTAVQHLWLVDRASGLIMPIANPMDEGTPGRYRIDSAHLSGDGSTVVVTYAKGFVPMSFDRFTYAASLDADRDGLLDAWETAFGLDPGTPIDAGLDPDNDGLTSLEEYAAGTHPRGTPVRYFAEGANGSFFATSLALFNPTMAAVTANVRFLGAAGATAAMPIVVPAQGPAYLDADEANLPFTEFSIVVESPVPLVAERRMTWDRATGYGSHASSGSDAPARTWYFAEGATIAGMQTFFLLQNPTATPATVTMRYLLDTGLVEERRHGVPAFSRLTVWANQEGGHMASAEFSTTIEADAPVVAERAMYRDARGEPFSAGSVAAGVAEPAHSFTFAEGATGSFFDTYLLVANPGDTPATVHVTYEVPLAPHGESYRPPIMRTHVVAPRSRRTIWVAQEDAALRETAVSARVWSPQAVVAERAMWWPGPTAATWRGTHADVGLVRPSWTWVAPDLPVGAGPGHDESFLLISAAPATYGPVWAEFDITVSCVDAWRTSRRFSLPALSGRTTIWLRQEFPEAVGRRCAATIASLPVRQIEGYPGTSVERPVWIFVESAVYGSGFASGAATAATPLPPP